MVKKTNMKGFEDLIKKGGAPKKNTKFKTSEYELLTFLEDENNRLSLIKNFFDTKVNNLKEYPQIEKLIQQQEEFNSDMKQKINEKLSLADSPLNQSMKEIFDSYFSKQN